VRSTRRLPVPAAAVALAAAALVALSACTGGASGTGAATDGKSASADGGTASPLPPGKYQTLPQPCASVDLDALRTLVPGAPDYSGTESLTYDTGRRVGCAWHSATPAGSSRSLTVDFERVVSYDPGVSDEVQAEADFDQRAQAASIPLTPPGGTAATTAPAAPTGTGAPDGSPDYAPRRLTNVGNAAFIDDVLTTPAAGPHRTVTLVFRTANVVVSVAYAAAEPAGAEPPSSADLQKGVQQVAAELERKVER
jgi:hypothetical protein